MEIFFLSFTKYTPRKLYHVELSCRVYPTYAKTHLKLT